MTFEVYIVCTVPEPINLGQLDRVADIAREIGLNTTMTALVFSAAGKALDHFFAALCAERAEMNMVAINIFTLLFFFVCHGKHLSKLKLDKNVS
jgi:hypothetical protein